MSPTIAFRLGSPLAIEGFECESNSPDYLTLVHEIKKYFPKRISMQLFQIHNQVISSVHDTLVVHLIS